MIILIKLILAHLIGDFVLQPLRWVNDKNERKAKSPTLYLHALIHGLLVYIFIGEASAWLPAICLMVIHLLIDLTKLYLQTERSKNAWFVLDQAFHLTSILVIWKLAYPALAGQSYTNTELKIWLVATAIVLLTNVSALVIQMMMRRWSEIIEKFTKNSLPNAGKYIGMLERSFILLFILTNHWEAIGFLLAAKSVFRFGDLNEAKEIKLTEYVLIGTLISFGIAILTGVVVQEILVAMS